MPEEEGLGAYLKHVKPAAATSGTTVRHSAPNRGVL